MRAVREVAEDSIKACAVEHVMEDDIRDEGIHITMTGIAYKTTDGWIFTDKSQAIDHQVQLFEREFEDDKD